METIKVLSALAKTTKTDKPYKALEVECGGEVRKVNMWSNFPDFANITNGSVFLGKMAKEGEYWNLSHEALEKRSNGANQAKQKVIEETMQRKEQSIGKFQDNKEFQIRVASTMSGAVQLAIAEYRDKTVLDTLDQAVLKWRKFLWNNWSVELKDIDPLTDKII